MGRRTLLGRAHRVAELAKQPCELLAFPGGEPGQEALLVGEVLFDHFVDQREAVGGQAYEHAPVAAARCR